MLAMPLQASKTKAIILAHLQGCNTLKRLRRIHAHVITNGLQHHLAISNKLLNFCAISVSGNLAYAELLFHYQIQNPQTQHWNSIIRGFSQSPFPLRAISYYNDMVSFSDSLPDTFSFSFVLKACERVKAHNKCREVHGTVVRHGYVKDIVVCTNLIKSYAGMGSVDIARKVFDEMSERDLVAWNSMISCYSQVGLHHETLRMYSLMRNQNVGLDGFTLVGLLSSCAHLGALNTGVSMHKIAREKKGLLENVYVGNALIDMYAKCGNLDGARCVFESMRKRDVFTWNSMIVGYGVHGRGDEAVSFFEKMMMAGVQPNSITFLGLLCGCSHQGLVNKGVYYFRTMSSKFNIRPGIKHYGCLVDLFGRAGRLEKALEAISTSGAHDDPVLWRTLLGSCKNYNNVEIGEVAMKNLVRLGSSQAGDYVLLAAIYFRSKNAYGVAKMRRLIKNQGVRTAPGWSWIEVGNQVHKFVVDDKSHPDTEEIYRNLKVVVHQAALHGYVLENRYNSMLQVLEDRQL